MNKFLPVAIAWGIILLAFYLAAVVVPITDAEACRIAGGDWNEAWSRCYGP